MFNFFKKRKQESNVPPFLYSEKEIDEYEKYVEEQFGSFKEVFHEFYSPDIHLDVLVLEPTEEKPYYRLITEGAGAFTQNVPKEYGSEGLERAEYVIYLPADWNIKSSESKDYWPIGELKKLARLPIVCDTWLGVGHTIHSNEDMGPIDPSAGFNSFLLLGELGTDGKKAELIMKSGKKINFYILMPLYQEELDYKLQNGWNGFMSIVPDKDLPPVVNPDRKKYC